MKVLPHNIQNKRSIAIMKLPRNIQKRPNIATMQKLPVEMLLCIFKLLSYEDLKLIVLVCRRWREIGETPRLWSSLHFIVSTRNMSVMPEILSSRRMEGLKKLRIETRLSKKVSQTIVRHTGLREFEISPRNKKQTITSVLSVISSRGCQGTNLKIKKNQMLGVDSGLLARAVTKVEALNVTYTQLTQQQAGEILTAVSEGNRLTKLSISHNDLSGIEPELLAKAVTKLEFLNVINTKLTQQQVVAIFTALSEENKLTELFISENDLSQVDPELLYKAIVNLKILKVTETRLTKQQAVAIFTAVSEGREMTTLYIAGNDLSGVYSGLLVKAVTKLQVLHVMYTGVTQQQAVAILTAASEGSNLTKLYIRGNDLSGVDSALLTKVVTRLEELLIGDTELTQQQIADILTAVSEGNNLTKLDISLSDLSEVDPNMLVKVVTKLQILIIICTKLTQKQIEAILSSISEESILTELNMSCDCNKLPEVDPGLLQRAAQLLRNFSI